MAQKALYPMQVMRVTQDEYGSYSHKGSPAQDSGGASPGTDDETLAPYDGTVARVRKDSSHETYFVSDKPVQLADGTVGILTTLFMHDNVLDVKQGQKIKRGEKIGDEGGFGGGRKDKFSHHVHIEVARGKQTTQARNKQGTYVIPHAVSLHDAFFVAADTQIVSGAGHAWKRTDETLVPGAAQPPVADTGKPPEHGAPLDTAKPMQLCITGANCEFFTARSVDKPVGKLPRETLHRVLEYFPLAVTLGALRGNWVRFVNTQGEEYYCLVLPDRAKLTNAWMPAVGDIVKATAPLNVRSAPNIQRLCVETLKAETTVTLAEIVDGWGFVRGKGWVCLAYTSAV